MTDTLSQAIQAKLEDGEYIVWHCKPSISPVESSRRKAVVLVLVIMVPAVLMGMVMLISMIFNGNKIYLGNIGSAILYFVKFLCAALVFMEYLRLMHWLFLRRISYLATNKRYIRLVSERIASQIGLSAIHRPYLSGMPKTAPLFYRTIDRILKPAPYVILIPKERSDWNAFNGADILKISGCESPDYALKSLQNAWEAAQ